MLRMSNEVISDLLGDLRDYVGVLYSVSVHLPKIQAIAVTHAHPQLAEAIAMLDMVRCRSCADHWLACVCG